MSGVRLTDQQIRIYMNERKLGKTQCQAAAKANLSERTGRRIDKGEITIGPRKGRHWRTRTDPLEPLWESVIRPLLEETPSLTPITIHEYLNDNRIAPGHPWPPRCTDILSAKKSPKGC